MPHRRRRRQIQALSSLNLPATSSLIARMAASASGPAAETMMVVPGPADSIIKPMIEVPPTVSLPRVTQTSALKRSTIWTNFAEARACRPRLLMIGISRDIAPGGTAGPVVFSGKAPSSLICLRERDWQCDVFAARLLRHRDGIGKRAFFTNLGKLHQHRKIDTCEHFHFRTAHAGDRKIGRRAAEHIGQDRDAITAVNAVDRFNDVASAQIRVVFGSDRDSFDLLLW